ncbi:acyl-CoA synthetase family protein [Nocardia terpenica]|uniref:Phenylacetate--CoA ligase family protein n=1 Tax=Nocardia terpenica TaxID=455432 RepID=A0A291RK74_9NOCA|nr:hypothetical protein [Nocardia terpenica]ATL67564.1 hypothetical protein CRH09_16515 [Nocardia terpenica]
MNSQPTADMVDRIRDIPLYRDAIDRGYFPILEKSVIADGFPDNWMTPEVEAALADGRAEFVLSTGTNHARMQLIRPPYFLLKSYYRLWSEHPDISGTWASGCPRISLTTVLATEHVARINAAKTGAAPAAIPALADRRLDERTVYVNLRLDPAEWTRAEVERMLDEIDELRAAHPQGRYHLDCSGYHLAHLLRKVTRWRLWDRFPLPDSIVHAYEYTPITVGRYLRQHFDCPIIDLFGSTELGYLYYSDRRGAYHPYLEDMALELVPIAEGSTIFGLIVSSVRNPYMPLIRYRSGDCVRTTDDSPDPAKIARFCGREKELLRIGTTVIAHADLDDWIAAVSSRVFLHQLHITTERRIVLRYTTFDDRPLSQSAEAELAETISFHTGMLCELAHRDHLPIGRSGKYAWLVDDLDTR